MMKKIANKRTTKLPTLIRQNDAVSYNEGLSISWAIRITSDLLINILQGESEAHELPDSSSGEEKADERRWTRSMARPQDNEVRN